MKLMISCMLFSSLAMAAPEKKKEADVAEGNTKFGLALFHELAKSKGNIFFSPYSVSSALAMTSAGARGATLDEMTKTLNLPADAHKQFGQLRNDLLAKGKDAPVLEVGNRLWTKQGPAYRKEFLADAKLGYGAEPVALDYAKNPETSRKTINDWVGETTHGKITDLMPSGSITEDTDLVLTNAIYFKGKWKREFEKKDTSKEAFFPEGGTELKHPMMHSTTNFDYAEDSDFQAVRLPYKGDALAMTVLLPQKGKKLSELEKKLTPPSGFQVW